MPETGEWFSPRTRPEMLTSDDPLVHDKYDAPLEHVEILPGPATLAGRVIEPFRRVVAFVPELGRRIVRVDDEPSRWQLAGMWATGSAIVAGTGLAVAAVLGGAPPALTQQLDRLLVLPGLNEKSSGSDNDPAPAADKAATSHGGTSGSSADGTRDRTSASDVGPSSGTGYSRYAGIPGVPGYPASVEVPGAGGSSGSGAGTVSGGGSPTKPVGGGGSTKPVGGGSTAPGNPAPPVQNPTDPAPPVQNPTDPAPSVQNPTDPAPPVQNPTDPAPPVQNPTDPAPPTEDPTPPDTPPGNDPPAAPPADPSPADPSADQPAANPPADPAPVADSQGVSPAPTSTP